MLAIFSTLWMTAGANTLYLSKDLALTVDSSGDAVGLTNLLAGVNWLTNSGCLYHLSGDKELGKSVNYTVLTNGEILVTLILTNPTSSDIPVAPVFPYILGLKPQGNYGALTYCFPQIGKVSDTAAGTVTKYYGGDFPMQFMDVYDGQAGGIYVMTHDLSASAKQYTARDVSGASMNFMTYYSQKTLKPHTSWVLSFVIGAHTGDWHAAFNAYRNWVATWYSPLVPRKSWFQDIYNLREMFLYKNNSIGDSGYDAYNPASKTYSFEKLLEQDKAAFGGDDYVHLFDWSQTPDHGRVGDYNPWDYLGGVTAFSNQVAQIRAKNIPVGLYFEGYLLSKNSVVGQTYGASWQLLDKSGKPYASEGDDNYYPCPEVPAWTNYIAGRCMSAISNCAANGVYIDEFGFGWQYPCFNPDHACMMPDQQVSAEGALMKQLRQSLPSSTVLYSEERNVDVNSQYQDGSFTYSINHSHAEDNPSRVNLARFAFPDFKLFEILKVDEPVGDNPQLYMSVFFNGEGFWLEGDDNNTAWFPANICTLIAKEHAILREYADAFRSKDPMPLVPTLNTNVYANQFPAANRTVWTLYNAGIQTMSGPLLRVPHKANSVYYDAWNGRKLTPRIIGSNALLTLSIPPGSAGCVVQQAAPELSAK
jgi:hypothetical protein